MTDREKLLEIRKSVSCHKDGCRFCDYSKHEHCMEELLVDHLLAHGVVVREKGEWQYTDDIDEDGNIQAYCSACGAGDKHATSMVGKVPYCWNCGADMRRRENG